MDINDYEIEWAYNALFTYISEPSHEYAIVLHVGGHSAEVGVFCRFLVLKISDEISFFCLENKPDKNEKQKKTLENFLVITYVHAGELLEIFVLLYGILRLLLDKLNESLGRPLATVLPFGHDPIAHVFQSRIFCDVETCTEMTLGRTKSNHYQLLTTSIHTYVCKKRKHECHQNVDWQRGKEKGTKKSERGKKNIRKRTTKVERSCLIWPGMYRVSSKQKCDKV